MDNKQQVLKIEKADIAGWKVITKDETYYIGEYGTNHGCFCNEGTIYKDRKAFESGDGICYINEYGFECADKFEYFEFYQKEMASSEITDNPYVALNGYTRQDFINICDGREDLAEELFMQVDWQCPETLWDEWLDDEEFCEQVGLNEEEE